MSDQIEHVAKFFERWADGAEGFHASIREYFTEETVWENVGYATTVGAEEAIAFLKKGEDSWGRDAIVAEILTVAQAGNSVLTERIDHEYNVKGTKLFAVPVMGIIELSPEGKILAWREYFDTAPIVAKRAAEKAPVR